MKTVRWFCVAALVAAIASPAARAQEGPKPGPEHEYLKKHVGTWDTTMKFAGMESRGVATYKMDLGGLWLVSALESEFAGQKFSGRGMDSYDAAKKKYVGVWVDSMGTSPLLMEGTFDKEKKALTMVGESAGPDGKPMKFKAVSQWKDDDTVHFAMYMADATDPAFTIVYKRRK